MSFSLKRISAAAAMLLGTTSVFAAPTCPESNDPQANYKCVFIDVGAKGTGDGKTGAFYELGLTGTLATSIYGLNGAGVIGTGSAITDTNRTSIINAAGFNGNNTYNTLGATTTNINDTASPGQRNIDALNPLAPPFDDLEGFNSAGGWALTFDYVFNGTLTATGPKFTSGDILFYYDDLSNGVGADATILRININGSTLNAANLDLFGNISFDFDNNGTNDCTTVFCQSFWNFQAGPQNWYAMNGAGMEISFALDTNVSPPIPTANQLAIGGVPGLFARQTSLDSSIRFTNAVPEPHTLALVGLALLGAGATARRRARKG